MQLSVGGVDVAVTRKPIKHMYLRVCSKTAQVSANVPWFVSLADVSRWVECRLGWIKKQQLRLSTVPLPPRFQHYQAGEYDRYLGKPLLLDISQQAGKPQAVLSNPSADEYCLTLCMSKQADLSQRRRLVEGWFRQELHKIVQKLMTHWQPKVGKPVQAWSIRKMKARWGSCHIQAEKILLNLALIHYPIECVEYVLVHELVHLHEPSHNAKFHRLVQSFLPHAHHAKQLLDAC